MKPPNAFAAAATAVLVAVFPLVGSQAQDTGNLVIAQMMNEGKVIQGQGMQGQGTQGMGGMEGRGGGTAGSNMQPQSQGGCPGGQCGPTQAAGMQGRMMGGMGMPGQAMQGSPMQMMTQGNMAELPTDGIEGRIAYLHAELRITEAQMPAWSEFDGVLRANAKHMADAQAVLSQGTNTSASDRLDDQERWLTARLESVRALKTTYGKLYAVLDDKQKKNADELIPPYLGVR